MELAVSLLETPLGPLTLVSTDEGLAGVAFENRLDSLWSFLNHRFEAIQSIQRPEPDPAAAPLRAYFEGEIGALESIATDAGGTAFQRQVWAALRRIPGGRTVSYSDLARSIGKPTGSRAVATANATNPVAIVIPCHRVIHADGTISGYGGGVERKRWLLRHEGDHLPFALGATIDDPPEMFRN